MASERKNAGLEKYTLGKCLFNYYHTSIPLFYFLFAELVCCRRCEILIKSYIIILARFSFGNHKNGSKI